MPIDYSHPRRSKKDAPRKPYVLKQGETVNLSELARTGRIVTGRVSYL